MSAAGLKIVDPEEEKLLLRMCIMGLSNSGKTFNALKIAGAIGKKIGIIDTENKSSRHYLKKLPFKYQAIYLDPPFSVERYVEAIKMFEDQGFDTLIVDSFSHSWSGLGGLLELHDRLADEKAVKYKKASPDSFSAWNDVNPYQSKLYGALFWSKMNIIATMRMKTEYVQETGRDGKVRPKEIGLSPVCRNGVEYEFDMRLKVDQETHKVIIEKDRTCLFKDQESKGEMVDVSADIIPLLKVYIGEGKDTYKEELDELLAEARHLAKKNVQEFNTFFKIRCSERQRFMLDSYKEELKNLMTAKKKEEKYEEKNDKKEN